MELAKIDPEVRVLVAIDSTVKGFIGKPFNLAELLKAVCSVLDGD